MWGSIRMTLLNVFGKCQEVGEGVFVWAGVFDLLKIKVCMLEF
jgi:hypothetical protein